MARPKLGEGLSQRFQMMISAEDLTAIEDWRFANRSPSLSDAVRRLCLAGIEAEAQPAENERLKAELAASTQTREAVVLPAILEVEAFVAKAAAAAEEARQFSLRVIEYRDSLRAEVPQ